MRSIVAQVALCDQDQSSDNGSMASSIAARPLAAMLGDAARRPAGLADGLRTLVVDGRLAVRTRVPSERALAAERRLPTAPDQIMITAGAQHALYLVLLLLTAPGDRVLVDAPAYPRTLSAIRTARARGIGVPLTATGWDVEAWTAALAAAAPRVALTAPDFHNPTGLTMGAAARAQLGDACARTGTVLVADETYADLRLDGPPLPGPLAAHAPGATVITLGTMSKAAWAGLRVGWLRAAPTLVAELAARRADVDMASPVLDQLLAVELLERWDEVLAQRRALVRTRRDALLRALAAHAPDWRAR